MQDSDSTTGIWIRRCAVLIWTGASIALTIKIVLDPLGHSLVPLLAEAARSWIEGFSIYYSEFKSLVPPDTPPRIIAWANIPEVPANGHSSESPTHFQYWPGWAALLCPILWLGPIPGGLLWSGINLGVFLAGSLSLIRTLAPEPSTAKRQGLFLLLLLPVALEGLWNQQSNPLMIGLILLGASALLRHRWWLAAFLLAMPVLVKVAPIAYAMLLITLAPRHLSWRWLIALLVLLAFPYLTQNTDYVTEMYRQWGQILQGEAGERWEYRDAISLHEALSLGKVRSNVNLGSMTGYRLLQLLASGCIFLIVLLWHRLRQADAHWTICMALALAAGWHMLFGPSSEISTYIYLAPPLAWAVLAAYAHRRGRLLITTAWLCIAAGSFGDLERALVVWSGTTQTLALLPFGVILYILWLFLYAPGCERDWRSRNTPFPFTEHPAAVG